MKAICYYPDKVSFLSCHGYAITESKVIGRKPVRGHTKGFSLVLD